MQIFHAAPTAFSIPDPNMFEGSRDFGPALYCSLDYISAARYLQRRLNGNGVILTSDIPIDIRHSHDDVATGLSVYVFDYQNPEDQADWVRQIVANRGW